MSFLIGAIKIIFLLGFLIMIHEGGHFLVAKACKVKVKEFSIGFGPKIFSKQGKETKYTLRLIPFGGYVDMLGEAEREKAEGSFSEASVIKRLAIVVAGATVNIIFGIIVYFTLMTFSGENASTIIKDFAPEYAQNLVALQIGDEILTINNEKIHLKSDIDKVISECEGKEIKVKVKRNNEIIDVNVLPSAIVTKSLGLYFSASTDEPKIKYIENGFEAEAAGIEINDIVTKIDNKEIKTYKDVSLAVQESINEKIKLEVNRNGKKINFDITPGSYTNYVLGVYLEPAEDTFINTLYYSYWKTVYFMGDILENVKMIFTGKVNMNQMVGPIGISEMVVETNGIYDFMYLMSLISLSLGVTNLLPIPALDGGRIVILLIEGIRRKPLKEEIEIQIQMIGFTLLILFSLYVSYKDILRIF